MVDFTKIKAELDDFRFLEYWAEPIDGKKVSVGVIMNLSEDFTDTRLDQATDYLKGKGYRVSRKYGSGALKTIRVSPATEVK